MSESYIINYLKCSDDNVDLMMIVISQINYSSIAPEKYH